MWFFIGQFLSDIMQSINSYIHRAQAKKSTTAYRSTWQRLHIDFFLFTSVLAVITMGLFILYSAANQNMHIVEKQLLRFLIAFFIMLIAAQIPPQRFRQWTPVIYFLGLMLLAAVLAIGVVSQGAERWLDLGVVKFQPSEIMKIAVPMALAWYFKDRQLPPSFKDVVIAGLIIIVPALLVAKQPDLGTALMISISGACVLLLTGLNWRWIGGSLLALVASTPVLWHFMHNYQRQRVLTFINPARDPLGTGYHIIQSKVAIGSGGVLGKGWLNGTQSHLNFLPAHATDFIFAVCGEELGLIGSTVLIVLYLFILYRCIYISLKAQDTYTRLLAGGLALTFFVSFYINIGMVTGIFPVVGIPLPLISYGGTSIMTLLTAFGILMSIHTHRKLNTK